MIVLFNGRKVSGAFIYLLSVPCWTGEQKLREFGSQDFMNDERKTEMKQSITLFSQGNGIHLSESKNNCTTLGLSHDDYCQGTGKLWKSSSLVLQKFLQQLRCILTIQLFKKFIPNSRSNSTKASILSAALKNTLKTEEILFAKTRKVNKSRNQ